METPFRETFFWSFYGNVENISEKRQRPWTGRISETRRQVEPKDDKQKGGKKEEEGKRHFSETGEEKGGWIGIKRASEISGGLKEARDDRTRNGQSERQTARPERAGTTLTLERIPPVERPFSVDADRVTLTSR